MSCAVEFVVSWPSTLTNPERSAQVERVAAPIGLFDDYTRSFARQVGGTAVRARSRVGDAVTSAGSGALFGTPLLRWIESEEAEGDGRQALAVVSSYGDDRTLA
jgi:hypothetical protein